jgi:hypothetical protein
VRRWAPSAGSKSPVAAQHRSPGLGSRQGAPGALADHFPLSLRHGGVDPHHQVIRAGHVGRPNLIAILQQPGERVSSAGNPIEPRRRQHRAELPAARKRRLEARPVAVLAAGNVAVLRDQGPTLGLALGFGKGADAGLLRLQPKPALALLGG